VRFSGTVVAMRSHRVLTRAGSAAALALLGGLCALVVAGCGSGSAAAPATSTVATTTTGTGTSGFAAYRACLAQHGLTGGLGFRGGFGGGFRGGAGTTTSTGTTPTPPTLTPAQQKALQACASLRPTGGFGGPGGFANNPAFQKFQACLKQHGVTSTGAGVNRSSPSYSSAFAACRSLLPAGGFGGGAFGGTGTTAGGGANPGAFSAFQACLKKHGVQTFGGSQPSTKTQQAITACRSVLQGSGSGTTTTTPTTTG